MPESPLLGRGRGEAPISKTNMKTLLTTLFAAAATSVAVAQSTLPTEYAQYDLDGDGTLTAADAQVIYHYILGTADESVTLEAVDLNADGAVNTADVVTLYVKVKACQEYLDSLPEGIEGYGNDTEGNHNFGERNANERRGEWGDLWADKY